MQKILYLIAVLAGIGFAYIDSRPNWDDTGALVVAILLVSGVIALLDGRRPWLIALAIGLWIPLHGIIISHNFGAIIALVIAFIGAYAGWVFRQVILSTKLIGGG
jgi:hypothetical protein